MYLKRSRGPASVPLPDGTTLCRSDLPAPDTQRWVASRKAAVVRAVTHGLLTPEDACETYALSPEELDSWQQAMARHGTGALKATRLQVFREGEVGPEKTSDTG